MTQIKLAFKAVKKQQTVDIIITAGDKLILVGKSYLNQNYQQNKSMLITIDD